MSSMTKVLTICLLVAIARANLLEDATSVAGDALSALLALNGDTGIENCHRLVGDIVTDKTFKGCGMCNFGFRRVVYELPSIRFFYCTKNEDFEYDTLKDCKIRITDTLEPFKYNSGCQLCEKDFEITFSAELYIGKIYGCNPGPIASKGAESQLSDRAPEATNFYSNCQTRLNQVVEGQNQIGCAMCDMDFRRVFEETHDKKTRTYFCAARKMLLYEMYTDCEVRIPEEDSKTMGCKKCNEGFEMAFSALNSLNPMTYYFCNPNPVVWTELNSNSD